MAAHYIIIGIFLLTGTLSLLAALLNWEWFFSAQNATLLVRRLKRPAARLIYGLLGLLILAFALIIYLTPPAG